MKRLLLLALYTLFFGALPALADEPPKNPPPPVKLPKPEQKEPPTTPIDPEKPGGPSIPAAARPAPSIPAPSAPSSMPSAGRPMAKETMEASAKMKPPSWRNPYRIIVKDFPNQENQANGLDARWTAMLANALQKSRCCEVVYWNPAKSVEPGTSLQPLDLRQEMIVDVQDPSSRTGFGHFTSLLFWRSKASVSLFVALTDPTTGSLVTAKRFTETALLSRGSTKQEVTDLAFQKALAEIVPWLTASIRSVTLTANLLYVGSDGKVVLNRGSRDGVTVGDILVVFEKPELLPDPNTSEALSEGEPERARVRVIKVNERISWCIVLRGGAGRLRIGMEARPLAPSESERK